MKRALIFLSITTLLSADTLECLTIQEGIKKIQCKFETVPKNYDRNVSFVWVSPDNASDNRTKIMLLPAGHKSVYDYRYFAGRSEGLWKISATVTEDGGQTVTTDYQKDSNAAVNHALPTDPLLREPLTH